MIFLSHALPEDNEFTRWLALRLAKEGYPVWCDLTKLLGGEDFWNDIEDAIRNQTTKFLFVLSRFSNEKQGVLQELALAKRVGKERVDFVIPLKIDDFPSDETTIELTRLNAIDCRGNWVTGLLRLLEKLEKDGVNKDPRFGPEAVATWWQGYLREEGGLMATKETYASNWFAVEDLPKTLYLHSLVGGGKDKREALPFDFPHRIFKSGVFSFAKARELNSALSSIGGAVSETQSFDLDPFQWEGSRNLKIDRSEARRIVTYLLREAFDEHCRSVGLQQYELAGRARCFWFRENFAEGNKVSYQHFGGRKAFRRMVGKSRMLPRDGEERFRTWHFGIQAGLIRWPALAMMIKSHVVFSEDGELYESSSKQHSARRSQCKMWHNDTWLDRMLAAMTFLAGSADAEAIKIPLSEDASFTVRSKPMQFQSPVSYGAPGEIEEQEDEAEDPELVEEIEEEEEL